MVDRAEIRGLVACIICVRGETNRVKSFILHNTARLLFDD